MIYLLATYDDVSPELVRREREDEVWPRLRADGAVPLGLWRVILGGRPGQVLELLRFDSLVHWAEITGLHGPSSGLHPSHLISLVPASRRHPGGQPSPVRPGSIWALRWLHTLPNQARRMVEISEDVFWPNSQHDERQTTMGMLQSLATDREQIVMLTRYESLADWEGTRVAGLTARTGPDAEAALAAVRERNDLVVEQGVRLLVPLSGVAPDAATLTWEGGGR